MEKYTKEDQAIIIQALSHGSRKKVMYDESDNKFYESPVGLFWSEVSKDIVNETISGLSVKKLKEEDKTQEQTQQEEKGSLVSEPKDNVVEKMAQKNNKMAIVGFVLSLTSIFGVGLAGIIGVMLGAVSLTQIKYTHEKGKGLAIAAIIIGSIWGFIYGIVKRLVEMGY